MINIIDWVVSAEAVTEQKVSRWWDAFITGPTASGQRVTPKKALGLSAYYAVLRNISEDVAKLPLKTYRRLKPRGKAVQPEHPVYRLLHDAPNREMTAIAWREAVTHQAVGWGGGFSEIERGPDGGPIALWPIFPSRVTIKRSRAGEIFYVIGVGDLNQRTQGVVIRARDMLHIHGLGATGVTGYVLSILGKEAIGLGLAMEDFGGRFFGNGSSPSGVLQHPGKLSEPAHENLRKSWAAGFTGVNAKKPAILEEGMEWKPMSIPPNEAQFLESRQFQIEEIARWGRMPPHKIQHLQRSTFNNIEHQAIEYVVDTLMTWLIRWEQECKRKLFFESEADYFVEHLVSGLMRGDSVKRSVYYRSMWNIGAMSQNDIRDAENLNPIEGGDVTYVPRNMIPADQAIAGNSEPPPTDNDQQQNDDDQDDEDDDKKQADERDRIVKAHKPLIEEAARRVVTKETKAIGRAAKKHAGDLEAFTTWAHDFYAKHAAYYVDALLPPTVALAELLGGPRVEAVEVELASCAKGLADARCLGTIDAFEKERVDEICEIWQRSLPERAVQEVCRIIDKEPS